MIANQLVIIGGGASIKEGVDKGLWDKINNKFVIGTNYSYKYYNNPTVQCFVDNDFYNKEKDNIKHLPLIIGQSHKNIKEKNENTILIKSNSKYDRNINTCGCYKSSLVGIFSLSLGIYLLDVGEIFLLGMDYGEVRKEGQIVIEEKTTKALTHFYQGEINHRGIGKFNYYSQTGRANKDYSVYKNETKCKIYNVSLQSRIGIFPKLSYDDFFDKLNNKEYNQNKLVEEIKQLMEK